MFEKYPTMSGGFIAYDSDAGAGAGGKAAAEQEAAGTQEEPASVEGEGAKNGEPFDAERAKAALNKKNSEAAGLRKRLKELEPLAEKAKKLEEASKSESEKLTEAKTSAEREAISAKAEAARLRVALSKGLTETQAKRLVGETKEELEADADELLESFKPPEGERKEGEAPEADPKRRPQERLRPGAVPEVDPDEETDPRKLAADLPSYS